MIRAQRRAALKSTRRHLYAKRKQLPDDLPAIIFRVYPESWLSAGPSIYSDLIDATNRFFSSGRVNAVSFMCEQHWGASGDGESVARFEFVGGPYAKYVKARSGPDRTHRPGPL
jgi:hypothetical protein